MFHSDNYQLIINLSFESNLKEIVIKRGLYHCGINKAFFIFMISSVFVIQIINQMKQICITIQLFASKREHLLVNRNVHVWYMF